MKSQKPNITFAKQINHSEENKQTKAAVVAVQKTFTRSYL